MSGLETHKSMIRELLNSLRSETPYRPLASHEGIAKPPQLRAWPAESTD